MNRNRHLLLALCALMSIVPWVVDAGSSAEMRRLFKKPTRDYSSGPLWVWNDMLTEDQIRDTLGDLASEGVKQVWVHPRPGLMTPYLNEDWFRLWKLSLKEAERLDMNVWIYDENSYPSGFAGGLVPELMPESRGRGLSIRELASTPKWGPETVAVYRLADGAAENVSARAKAGEDLGSGRFLVATEVRSGNSPWHGDRCYVNLLSPGVTEKFIEVTLEPYRKEIGAQFGKRVPGVFTDEPNIRPAGGFPWSEILAAEFKERWGYDLLDHLPSLARPIGDWRKVRHNYFQVLHEQFVERWAKPNFEYCETNNLEWTGHYWDHDWPDCMGVPDNMAMYAWHQRPSIDCLMNQYAEHTHAQFGNVRMVKELSSVANQLGWKRTLCEIYGAGGWDLRFEDMKRIGDWLSVLGVNTMNQHLSYVTLRGARKRDHPQSFSYHDPWWEAYHVSADYLARLSVALTRGEQVNRVLVLEPTTTAWMYQGDGARLGELGDAFFKLLMALEAAQVEYDIGCEDVMEHHGFAGEALQIGKREYHTIVIPPLTETLNVKTRKLLQQSKAAVIHLAGQPPRTDGLLTGSQEAFDRASEEWRKDRNQPAEDLIAALASKQGGFAIDRAPEDRGILFHMRRELPEGEILFLVNTSMEHPSSGTIRSRLKGAERWDPYTGKIEPFYFAHSPSGITADYELPPSGSLLLFLSREPRKPGSPSAEAITIGPLSPPAMRRLEPNVLTLDYVDITAGGETRKDIYFYQANQFAWRKNGMERNPWDSAVQFKDELISKTFPPSSGFEASYRFSLADRVPHDLAIVIERPDLYSITCNGQPVQVPKEWARDWWLDRAFGRLAIATHAKLGENIVTVKASPFTMFHELEPAYLLGSFSLRPTESGFVAAADRGLKLGSVREATGHSITPEGTMWLSAGIGFGGSTDDRVPFLIFDLGRAREVSAVKFWNYNEAHVRDLTRRGAKAVRITGALNSEPQAHTLEFGTFELKKANPALQSAETLNMTPRTARFIRVDFLSNHYGLAFPATSNREPEDNGFVGLAEVQFIATDGPVTGVTIAKASSELASHGRFARSLVDGSGLGSTREGWDSQGHPFYSHGVSYRETFEVKNAKLPTSVHLPNWYGCVARVTVNGKLAGYIDAPPWECDATSFLRRGRNDVEVTVFGTLKNLLGPHHGNPALGAAWPSGFHRAPETGPPAGAQYHTLGYGLFEPFVLKQSASPLQSARSR